MGAPHRFLAWADSSSRRTGRRRPATHDDSSYNVGGSFGMTGMPQLKITPTADTPSFISTRSRQAWHRAARLLSRCGRRRGDGDELQASQDQYAGDSSFFSFEAHDVNELGDVLSQLMPTIRPCWPSSTARARYRVCTPAGSTRRRWSSASPTRSAELRLDGARCRPASRPLASSEPSARVASLAST